MSYTVKNIPASSASGQNSASPVPVRPAGNQACRSHPAGSQANHSHPADSPTSSARPADSSEGLVRSADSSASQSGSARPADRLTGNTNSADKQTAYTRSTDSLTGSARPADRQSAYARPADSSEGLVRSADSSASQSGSAQPTDRPANFARPSGLVHPAARSSANSGVRPYSAPASAAYSSANSAAGSPSAPASAYSSANSAAKPYSAPAPAAYSSVITGHVPAENREEVLANMIERTEKALLSAPTGSLIIRRPKHKKSGVDYYRYMPGNLKSETYIPRKDAALIQALAQKEYNHKVLKLMKQQLSAIKTHHMQYFPGSLDEIFNKLSKERQALVTPAEPTTAQYIQLWQDIPYPESAYSFEPERPYYTDLGELVRSKSEVLIANALLQSGVPYKYECPLALDGGVTVRPDFTLLDIRTRREIYFEHFGMMDDAEYLKSFFRKLNLYETNGIFPGADLICTFESSTNALDTRILKTLISKYGK